MPPPFGELALQNEDPCSGAIFVITIFQRFRGVFFYSLFGNFPLFRNVCNFRSNRILGIRIVNFSKFVKIFEILVIFSDFFNFESTFEC